MSPLLEAEIARTLAALSAPKDDGLGFDKHEWLERVRSRPVEDGDLLLVCVDPATEAMIAKRQEEFMVQYEAGTLPPVSEGPMPRMGRG